jgi:hypothetical protein
MMKFTITIIMLFSLFIVQAHNIIQHDHITEAKENSIDNNENTPHFELSDIFSNFHHFGQTIAFSKSGSSNITGRFKSLKSEYPVIRTGIDHLNLSSGYMLKPAIGTDNIILNSDADFLFSLRAPPAAYPV